MNHITNHITQFINQTPKPKLILLTSITTLIASYIISAVKSKLLQKVKSQKLKHTIYVGIQLGGTNYNVAIARPIFNSQNQLMDFDIIQTKDGVTYQDPQKVITQIVQFIQTHQPLQMSFSFIGIASFGPLCLDKQNPNFGQITTTPKKLWQNKQILNQFKTKLNTQNIKIQTDVNSCAYAQYKLGNHHAKQSLAYITVGTGVGVGVVVNGKTVHGLTHPEGGHIIVTRHEDQYAGFEGCCPFHKSCLEGMVCNKSIAQRLRVNFTQLHTISDHEKVWKILGYYLAQLCLNITLTVSPQVIVIGGGIMNRKILYKYIQEQFIKLLAKYVQHPLYTSEKIQQYIKGPTLGSQVGVKGAMMLRYQ